MAKKIPFILWFKEISKKNIPEVGGKGANLGELVKAGIPVPSGFCVTAQAYYYYLERSGLKPKIEKLLRGLNAEDNKKLNKVSQEIKKMILGSELPEDLAKEVKEAYLKLGGFPVAIRSSATAEDLPDVSFAGQHATFLNTSGKENVIKATLQCYASLFEARAIYYRIINKFEHMKVGLSAVVQNMIQSEYSGIMFTIDPVSEKKDLLVIEAGYGLGEAIVSGSITPDRYVVDKDFFDIEAKEVNTQTWKIVHNLKGGDKHVSVAKAHQSEQKITNKQIIELAKMGVEIEKHYKSPQDTEWAIENGKIYFVQSRPITTLGKCENSKVVEGQSGTESKSVRGSDSIASLAVLLKGAAASLGSISGPVKIIHKPTEIDKIMPGDILVTEMTTPDYVPAMRKASAIVTDTGGRTCHAAIVSRELGIPCVVGTGKATSILKNGQIITVDGVNGLVCLLYTSPSPRDGLLSRMPSSA